MTQMKLIYNFEEFIKVLRSGIENVLKDLKFLEKYNFSLEILFNDKRPYYSPLSTDFIISGKNSRYTKIIFENETVVLLFKNEAMDGSIKMDKITLPEFLKGIYDMFKDKVPA